MSMIKAPMVGKLVSYEVKVGDMVKKDDIVAKLEALKMFINVYSPSNGVVKELGPEIGNTVQAETTLIILE